jgi:hypothetical protein
MGYITIEDFYEDADPSIARYQTTHVTQITDTTDDNAREKISSAYDKHLGLLGLRGHRVNVRPALNTIEIGFAASELIYNFERPDHVVVAVNCAGPDKEEGTVNNARNDFFAALIGKEDVICGTSNGHEFSYVKEEITELYRITTTNSTESQFRSLEILPGHTLAFSSPRIRDGLIRTGALKRIEHVDDIVPSPPSTIHVVEVDNFKNVKFYTSSKDLEFLRQQEGKQVKFAFGKETAEVNESPGFWGRHRGKIATTTPTFFAAPIGTNVLALKSSSFIGAHPVPILATIRKRPAETNPNYPVPLVGAPVRIVAARSVGDILRTGANDSRQYLQSLKPKWTVGSRPGVHV